MTQNLTTHLEYKDPDKKLAVGTHLHKQIVATGDRLHDVPFDFVILQDGQSVVDQDRRVGRFEVGPEVGRRFLHVHCCDLCEKKKKNK